MSPDMEYPLLCVGVRRGYSSDLRLDVVRLTATEAFLDDGSVPEDVDGNFFSTYFKIILSFITDTPILPIFVAISFIFEFLMRIKATLDQDVKWDHFSNKGLATVLPQRDALDVVCVTPLDKEAILVAHDSIVQVVDIHGQATRTRSMKTSTIKFSFRIEAIGK